MKSMMFNGVTLFFLLVLPVLVNAQDKYSTKAAAVTVAGTSTMHDWEMKAANGDCTIGVTAGLPLHSGHKERFLCSQIY